METEKILLHEMIHALTDEFYSKSTERFVSRTEIEDSRESLTDHITNVVYALLEKR